MQMQSYPRELSEGIAPLLFAVDGTDHSVDGAASSSSFDSLIQHMTLTHKQDKRSAEPVVSSTVSENTASHSFFSRAQVVTVSKSHAFPPSSDPGGNANKTSKISSVLGLRAQATLSRGGPPSPNKVQYSTASVSDNAILSYLRRNPIEGILSEGWIEKHAHALPSVVLVVAHLDFLNWNNNKPATSSTSLASKSSAAVQPAYYHQAKVEKHLSDLCDHIRSSLAEKRACSIHLVCIVPTQSNTQAYPTSASSSSPFIQASSSAVIATIENEKIYSLRNVCKLSPGAVSILHYSTTTTPSNTPFPTTELLKLETALQETSLAYYRHQMKRLKDKLHYLQLQTHPELLTAAARYSLKMAIFVELEDRARGSMTHTNATATASGYYGTFMASPLFPKVAGKGKDASSSLGVGESLKYWYDAYDFVASYYRYLMEGTIVMGTREMESNNVAVEEEEEKRNIQPLDPLSSNGDDSNPPVKDTSGIIVTDETVEISQEVLDTGDEMAAVLSSPLDLAVDQDIEKGEPINNNNNPTTTAPTLASTNHSIHAEDMHHQCRGFADWVNYKILSKLCWTLDTTMKSPLIDNPLLVTDVNFLNHRKVEILESLAKQVRRHCGIFLHTRHRNVQNVVGHQMMETVGDMFDPLWNRLLYAYQERVTLAQLVERYVQPLYLQMKKETSAVLVTGEVWDVLCASSLYASVGDCVLRLDSAIQKEMSIVKKNKTILHDENRRKFVGSLSLFALKTRFREERQRNFLGIAIDFMHRAVALREEMNKASNKGKDVLAAKYRFVIGLILMKEKKYDDAVPFFQVALDRSQHFPQVNLAISRALVECYKSASSLDLAMVSTLPLSVLLDPNASSLMTSSDLFDMIKVIPTRLPDTKAVDFVWSKEKDSPISYSVTFPETVCAIHGDEVPVAVQLRSNLPFALKLSEMQLSTNVGITHVINCEGAGTSTILSPNKIYCFRTSLKIQNIEHLISITDGNRDSMKASKSNTYGLSYIHAAGSIHGKLINHLLMSGAISLRLSSLSLTVSPSDIRNRGIILQLNCKDSKPKAEKETSISSSWNRPGVFPMKYGSSHIYITQPKARIEVSNLTANFTKGKVLEGTVNRIIFELKPGSKEACRNIEVNISCSSAVIHDQKDLTGHSSSSLLDQEELLESDDFDRPPVLVHPSPLADSSLPMGWSLYGDNGRGTHDQWLPVASFVHEGSVAHAVIDLFRPLPSYIDPEYAQVPCQTDITLSVRYLQIRSDRHNQDEVWVTKEFHDTVIWCPPMNASFSVVTRNIKSLPTGNYCHCSPHATTFLQAGDLVPIRCSVQAAQAVDGLFVRLLDASFSSTFDEHEEPCHLELVGNPTDKVNNMIFQPKQNDVDSLLKAGTNMSLLYVIRPTCKDSNFTASPIFTRLGAIRFNWKPMTFVFSTGIQLDDAYKGFHGPLALSDISPVVYAGPRCYLEETPFSVYMKAIVDSPKVLAPFDVEYQVVNKYNAPQRIRVQSESSGDDSNRSFVVAGVGSCEIHLGPMEKKSIFYTMLALRSGKVTFPTMTISSDLSQSWVVHGGGDTIILP